VVTHKHALLLRCFARGAPHKLRLILGKHNETTVLSPSRAKSRLHDVTPLLHSLLIPQPYRQPTTELIAAVACMHSCAMIVCTPDQETTRMEMESSKLPLVLAVVPCVSSPWFSTAIGAAAVQLVAMPPSSHYDQQMHTHRDQSEALSINLPTMTRQ